jgi:large subunit ribosomal protein L17
MLSRDKDHKKALFRNLISALILQDKIKTTRAKANAVKGLVDKTVNYAKDGGLRRKDYLANFLTSKAATKKMYEDIINRFKDRQSGYTRIMDVGTRKGDNARMVVMEWVKKEVRSKKLEVRSKTKAKTK